MLDVQSNIKSSERDFVVNNNFQYNFHTNEVNVEINNDNPKKESLDKNQINIPIKDEINNNNNLKEKYLYKNIIQVKSGSEKSENNNIDSLEKNERHNLPLFNLDDENKSEDNKIIDQSLKKEKRTKYDKYCLICNEKLTHNEYFSNYINCYHFFCNDCYYNYFKEKIENNNNVAKIKCPKSGCTNTLFDYFIQNKISNDISLLDKYLKFKERRQLMYNPDYQICPYPDCESYVKKGKNKYVSCIQNGHKFCLKCLKGWHGNESCKIDKDKSFESWRNSSNVKKCPKCKYYVEKIDGCNHMTCFNCKYQWCWLCLNEYEPNHFDSDGKCSGLQNADCECFSNKCCLFLYKLFISLVKFIIFAILASFVFFLFLNIKLFEKINYDPNGCIYYFSYSSIVILCLSFGVLLISISSFISLIMLIIFPLQEIIIKKLINMLED